LNQKYGVNFEIFVDDPAFDNDDNEYGKIKLHNYINMRNSKDYESINEEDYPEIEDIIIPLTQCTITNDEAWIDPAIKKYCPSFGDEHFLYGDHYSFPSSWYRLSLQFCDPIERVA